MIRASRDLRHIHHRVQTRLFGCGGEGGRRLEKPVCDRVREVRALHAVERRAHDFEVANVADGDFGAESCELVGPVIGLTNESSNGQPHCEQLASGMVAGGPVVSGCSDYYERWRSRAGHVCSRLKLLMSPW